jgi:hypothetical protein
MTGRDVVAGVTRPDKPVLRVLDRRLGSVATRPIVACFAGVSPPGDRSVTGVI